AVFRRELREHGTPAASADHGERRFRPEILFHRELPARAASGPRADSARNPPFGSDNNKEGSYPRNRSFRRSASARRFRGKFRDSEVHRAPIRGYPPCATRARDRKGLFSRLRSLDDASARLLRETHPREAFAAQDSCEAGDRDHIPDTDREATRRKRRPQDAKSGWCSRRGSVRRSSGRAFSYIPGRAAEK